MKEIRPRDKILKICIYATVSVCIVLLFYKIIADLSGFYGSVATVVNFIISVLKPVLIGLVIAYVLHRLVATFERWILKTNISRKHPEKKKEKAHSLGVLCAVLSAIIVVGLILSFLIPTVIDSIAMIADEAPAFVKIAEKFFVDLKSNNTLSKILELANLDFSNTEQINSIISTVVGKVQTWLQNFGKDIIPAISATGNAVVNFFLGLVFSIYILLNQEQLVKQSKRFFSAIISEKAYVFLAKVGYNMDDLFFKYLSGKLFTSTIVGIICGVSCAVFGIKYAFTIALIIGITNLIPVVGPWLGAIPAVLLSLLSGPMSAVILVIIILIDQQIESNILEPKIQGDSIGINSFWVLFGIIVFGKLFGIVGMILALPVCGVLRMLISEWLDEKEKKKAKQTKIEAAKRTVKRG